MFSTEETVCAKTWSFKLEGQSGDIDLEKSVGARLRVWILSRVHWGAMEGCEPMSRSRTKSE